jgi:hypothetical protein
MTTVGVAMGAALMLAAAPAGASSPVGAAGPSETSVSTGAQHGTAVKSSAYTFTVVRARCTASKELLTIKQVEHGRSGVTRFKQGFQGQYLTEGGWRVSGTRIVTSNSFPNNGRSYTFKAPTQYNYGATRPASHRIVWTGQWLSGKRVIAHASRIFLCR